MNRSAIMRSFTGLITLFIYGIIGMLSWPSLPWLTYTMVVLGVIRLVLLIRQLPSRSA